MKVGESEKEWCFFQSVGRYGKWEKEWVGVGRGRLTPLNYEKTEPTLDNHNHASLLSLVGLIHGSVSQGIVINS